MVVVLPAPLTPTTRMMKGFSAPKVKGTSTGFSTFETSEARMRFTSSGSISLS